MNNKFKVAIIGGGAAGVISAIELCRGNNALKGEEIVILERSDRLLKKLVATGNGQGNLTNADLSEKDYHGDKTFVKEALTEFSSDISTYFYSLGIPLKEYERGRIYPVSRQASAVSDVLRDITDKSGVNVIYNFYVDKIEKKEEYEIYSGENKITAKYVITAFGGKAQKNFGTDGSSYRLTESLGHKTTPLYPSLVQLKCEKDKIKGLSGLKENAKVYALDGDKILKETVGEVLFTDYGISGNAIFYLSAYLTDAIDPKVRIEFLPDYGIKETAKLLKDKLQNSKCDFSDVLTGIINKRIGKAVLKGVTGNDVDKTAYALKNFTLKVTGSLGFDSAQVTKGGVETKNINPKTFESRINGNLFVVGEALNIDGDCGGYNLSFAFIGGILSAREIKEKNKGV